MKIKSFCAFLFGVFVVMALFTSVSNGQEVTGKGTLNLNEYTGDYYVKEVTSKISIFIEEGKLYGQPEGKGKALLTHKDGDQFEGRNGAIIIKFIRDENKKVIKFVGSQNGMELNGEKELKVEAKKVNLNDYAGSYYIEEVSSPVAITVENGKLFAEPEGKLKGELVHKEGDQFEGGNGSIKVKFMRDDNKKVIKFILNQNGRELVGEKVKK